MNRYKILWERIRNSATPVAVKCPKGAQERLAHQMQKYKSRINVMNKSLGLPSFGRMEIVRGESQISFYIPVNGEHF
jgi:hypothetical protein